MAYTTFYCNESLLLNNWEYYKESNLMLKNLLRRTSLSPTDCATYYFEHMKNPQSVTYDRSYLIQMFSRGRKNIIPLMEKKQIVLYKHDFEYLKMAQKVFHITYHQLRILFGVIFFSRLFEDANVALDTMFKLRRFAGCFNEETNIVYCKALTWDGGYNTIAGLKELSEVYHLLVRIPTNETGCIYQYPWFDLDNNDAIEYVFNVTLENNRLNLSNLVSKFFSPNQCYCMICGDEYYADKPNASLYCKDCALKKEQLRIHRKNQRR